MNSITMLELLKLMPNVKLIDVRDKYEYIRGSIPNAVNIPMQFLMVNPDTYIDKNNIYYLFCASGQRSMKTSTYLNKKGYHTVNVMGGYKEYLELKKRI